MTIRALEVVAFVVFTFFTSPIYAAVYPARHAVVTKYAFVAVCAQRVGEV